MDAPPHTRIATIALAGKPNVGKSTLLNTLVGQKLAITSAKPQSSRKPVFGVWTDNDVQLIFADLPGLFTPEYLLQESMIEAATQVLASASAVLHLHPAADGTPEPLAHLLPELACDAWSVATVLTKADLVPALPPASPALFPVSAVTGEGIPELLAWCQDQAVPGPFRQDADEISTQSTRFFVEELVREAAFEVLEQELPYSVAASVDEFREGSSPVYIRVVLYVERESQKGMVIGKHGATIKRLGAHARTKIEDLLGEHVYLDLWTKVLPKWRTRPKALRSLGFPVAAGGRANR